MSGRTNHNREIGPVGTLARVSAGVAALFIALFTHAFSVWNLIAGLAVLPALAIAVLPFLGPRGDRSTAVGPDGGCPPSGEARPWTTECALLALVAVFVVAASFFTSITEGSILIWLGASFLLSSVLGYAGCEMVALPNMLTGRQHRLPCFLFSSLDRAERRRRTLPTPE
jgi:hypothetical protein